MLHFPRNLQQVDDGENYNSNNNVDDLALHDLHLWSDGEDSDQDLNCNNNNNGSGDEAERPPKDGHSYPQAQQSQGPTRRQHGARKWI